MVEHDVRAKGAHGTVEGLCSKALEKGVRGAVLAHAIDDVCTHCVLFQHGINRIDIILQVSIHTDRYIRIGAHGHETREQRILVPFIVCEIDPRKERAALRTAANEFPCTVTAAIVDEGDAALRIDLARIHQLSQLALQFIRRISQHFLLVVTGHNEIEDRGTHSLSSLKIQSPSRSSTSCQFSAPNSFIIF